jgi:hypothetical protein
VAQHRGLASGGAQVALTGGRRENPLSSPKTIQAPRRRAFFIRGQSSFTQRAIASSSRSTARRAGRCRLQPSRWRRTVHVCVVPCRTPVTFSISSATRASVHISVGNPFAFGAAVGAAEEVLAV